MVDKEGEKWVELGPWSRPGELNWFGVREPLATRELTISSERSGVFRGLLMHIQMQRGVLCNNRNEGELGLTGTAAASTNTLPSSEMSWQLGMNMGAQPRQVSSTNMFTQCLPAGRMCLSTSSSVAKREVE